MNHLIAAQNLAYYKLTPTPIRHSAPLTADACYIAAQVAAEQGRHEDACSWLNMAGEIETACRACGKSHHIQQCPDIRARLLV